MRSAGVLLSLACTCLLSGNAAPAQQTTPQKAAGDTLTIDLSPVLKPWAGDLDGMIRRRVIRVLPSIAKPSISMTRVRSAAP